MRAARRRLCCGVAIAGMVAGAMSRPAPAAEGGVGGLLIAPTRVELAPRQRSAELTLMNRGSKAGTYRLELVEKRMTDDGQLVAVPAGEPAPLSAASMVRFSPRQVQLAPGASQKVRLLARRPAGLPPGEYRSHLLIQTLPDPGAAPEAPGPGATARLSVRLVTMAAVSIPVIVRHGETHLDLALTDLALAEPAAGGPPRVRFRLERAGNRSAYGDVVVEWTPAAGGAPVALGAVRGVAVYAPNASRRVEVALTSGPVPRGGGVLRVTYRAPAGNPRSPLAEGTLVLN